MQEKERQIERIVCYPNIFKAIEFIPGEDFNNLKEFMDRLHNKDKLLYEKVVFHYSDKNVAYWFSSSVLNKRFLDKTYREEVLRKDVKQWDYRELDRRHFKNFGLNISNMDSIEDADKIKHWKHVSSKIPNCVYYNIFSWDRLFDLFTHK